MLWSREDKMNFKNFLFTMKKNLPVITIGLVAECILFSLLTPSFFTFSNFLTVARQASINSIIAFGMTFVIITGGIDLSVGSTVALAGVITAYGLSSGLSVAISIIIGLICGLIIGATNGIVVTKTNIPPFIVTLGMMTLARGLAGNISNGYPISIKNQSFLEVGKGYITNIPIPVIIMFFVFIIFHILLSKTKYGAYVYAIGGNENAAYLSGINISKNLVLVYVISGILSALSGIILASRLFSGQPSAGSGFELDAIAAVILGGTSFTGGIGNLIGTIFGAFTISILLNGLALLGVSYYNQLIIRGLVIMFALLFLAKD